MAIVASIKSGTSTNTLQGMKEDIDVYVSQHGRQAVFNDADICNRKFVLANYACPYMVGRNMHEFLNAFIGAYTLNRTLIWQFCPRKPCSVDDEESCSKYLTRSPWIVSIHEIESHYKNHNCRNIIDRNHQLIDFSRRHWADRKLACCGLDRLNETLINFGVFFDRHEMFHLTYPFARLNRTAFSRAQRIFSLGEDAAYGLMFRTAFTFTKSVISKNADAFAVANPTLASTGSRASSSEDTLMIGLHLRHSSNSEAGTRDSGEIKCLEHVLKQARERDALRGANRTCVILLASDRAQAVERTRDKVKSYGCLTVTTNHSSIHTSYGEHGPYWGEIAMLDMELLSNSEYFIGSSYIGYGPLLSSYSMLVSGLVSTNDIDTGTFAVSNASSSDSMRTMVQSRISWLPYCGKAVSGKHLAEDGKSLDKDTFEQCDSSVMLPDECARSL